MNLKGTFPTFCRNRGKPFPRSIHLQEVENSSIKTTEASQNEIRKPVWWPDLGCPSGAQGALTLPLLSRMGRK